MRPPLPVLAALPLLLAASIWPVQSLASDCTSRYPAAETLARTFDMAAAVERSLDALSPATDVVLLARGGQDLSRFGLTYSHLGFALRGVDGHWAVVHELNRCGVGESDLYREGLANFVGESVLRADILVAVPIPELQARLKDWLEDAGSPARALHEAKYSMVAYPFSTKYQNSNQWVLEVLAAAAMQVPGSELDRQQVQAWLRTHDFSPSKLHIKLHERLAVRFGVGNATTVDHPVGERLSGNYSVVTVDSVVDFMRMQNWLVSNFHVERAAVVGRTEEERQQ